MDNEIIIVSGLPRSGTSLMMQMLDNGGIPVVTDHIRTADTDNPRGYYEFEQVKKIKEDVSWLPETRGKAFKMVSQLLYELPSSQAIPHHLHGTRPGRDARSPGEDARAARINRPPLGQRSSTPSASTSASCASGSRDSRTSRSFTSSYNDLVERPEGQAERVSAFLDGRANAASMAQTVDPSLYRNRKTPVDPSGEPVAGGTA